VSVLAGLVAAVRAGESRALVIHGEPGVGKTALLEYLAGKATGCRLERAAGVRSEMELAFAGLHQLCASMLDHQHQGRRPKTSVLLRDARPDPGYGPNFNFMMDTAAGRWLALDGETPEPLAGAVAADFIDRVLSGTSAAARPAASGGASLLDETVTA
jgi:hypothetical protein